MVRWFGGTTERVATALRRLARPRTGPTGWTTFVWLPGQVNRKMGIDVDLWRLAGYSHRDMGRILPVLGVILAVGFCAPLAALAAGWEHVTCDRHAAFPALCAQALKATDQSLGLQHGSEFHPSALAEEVLLPSSGAIPDPYRPITAWSVGAPPPLA